jgi:hypothetical protein
MSTVAEIKITIFHPPAANMAASGGFGIGLLIYPRIARICTNLFFLGANSRV